jgi:hypothetical protein
MTAAALRLPPLDSNLLCSADADAARRERYLRKLLAEGRLSPSRSRLVVAELREIEDKRAKDATGN